MTHASSPPVYSERLGAIANDAFAAAVARLGLGAFIAAEPVEGGLFGQNVFLTTTTGEFVFRGAPHWVKAPGDAAWRRDDRVQFAREAFYIRLVHARTGGPVPWPCHHDPASDLFGWPYLIMPRMPGDCFDARSLVKALAPRARREVAMSMGAVLADLHRLTWPTSGDFDVDLGSVASDAGGYAGFLTAAMMDAAGRAQVSGAMTDQDMDWLARIAGERGPARPSTFVHGDFKLDNLTVGERDGVWRVTGLFDFHTARFGDGAYDLVRQACAWRDTEPELTRVFVDAWREGGGDGQGLAPWLPLYVASERLAIWSTFVTPRARPAWAKGRTFKSWSEPYLEALAALL